jgi:hypothetical protein
MKKVGRKGNLSPEKTLRIKVQRHSSALSRVSLSKSNSCYKLKSGIQVRLCLRMAIALEDGNEDVVLPPRTDLIIQYEIC